jgi:hypothetical protein
MKLNMIGKKFDTLAGSITFDERGEKLNPTFILGSWQGDHISITAHQIMPEAVGKYVNP